MKLCVNEECQQRGGSMDVRWQEAEVSRNIFPTLTP